MTITNNAYHGIFLTRVLVEDGQVIGRRRGGSVVQLIIHGGVVVLVFLPLVMVTPFPPVDVMGFGGCRVLMVLRLIFTVRRLEGTDDKKDRKDDEVRGT